MVGHAAMVQSAKIERFAKYFFLLLISLMVRHAAMVRCAMFVRSAKIERFAKYFSSPVNFSNGRTCCNYVVCYFCAVC